MVAVLAAAAILHSSPLHPFSHDLANAAALPADTQQFFQLRLKYQVLGLLEWVHVVEVLSESAAITNDENNFLACIIQVTLAHADQRRVRYSEKSAVL